MLDYKKDILFYGPYRSRGHEDAQVASFHFQSTAKFVIGRKNESVKRIYLGKEKIV